MYTLINQTPAIYHSANPAVMFRIIEHDGIISEKTFLYGYCVGVSYGKNGLTWVITNLIGGKLELYWSKVDKVNPLNVEMIANILVKRSGREFDDILGRAYIIMERFTTGLQIVLHGLFDGDQENIRRSLELYSISEEEQITKIKQLA